MVAIPRKAIPFIVFAGINGSAAVGDAYGVEFPSTEIISPFALLRVRKYFEKSVKYLAEVPSLSTMEVFAFETAERVTCPPTLFISCNTIKGKVVLLLCDASSN